jgi:hypothetical protein
MSDKSTCPGCNAHTSAVRAAVREERPCPYCGLSADVIEQVNAVQDRLEETALTRQWQEAVIRADRAEREAELLRTKLDKVRRVLDEKPEESPW